MIRLRRTVTVIRRAIHPDSACRYQTARALHGDLLVLANGASVLRLRALEGLWIRIKRFSKAAALVVAVLGTASYWHFKERSVREHEQQQRIGQQTASGMQHWDQLDYGAALGAFASALNGTEGHPANDTDFRFITTLARMPGLLRVGWAGAPIHSLDIASDGTTLSLGLQDGRCELRDFPSLQLRRSLNAGTEPVLSCRFRTDGKAILTANMDGKICLQESDSQRTITSWQTASPAAVAFSATSNLLYTGSASGVLTVWDLEKKLPIYEHLLSRKALDGIASGKQFLALSSRDGSVRVFATDDLAHERWKFQDLHAAYCVALSPDETLVAAGFDDGQAQVWSTETGAKVLPPLKHTRGITSIGFSPDGMLLLTTSFEGYAKVWSTVSGLQETTALPQAGHVRAARFAPDGRRIVVAGFDGSIRLWDLGGIMSPQKIPRGSTLFRDGVWASSVPQPPALALSSEHGLVTLPVPGEIKAIETSLNRNLLLIVIKSASDTWTIRGLAENSSQFLPWVIERKGSQPIINAGADTFTLLMGRRVECFSWMDGSPVGVLDSPDDAVTRATPPDSGWGSICTGTNVILFRGSARLTLHHELKTSRAVMSPDGSRVVTCTLTKGLRPCYAQVWKVASGEPVSPRLRHSDGVQDAAWSKDGRLLVTVDEDGIGIIWNTASWVPVGRSLRHSDQILSVKIGGSPEMIATASADRTVRLWELQTGLPLTPPLSMTFDVSSVSFLKDGLLATEFEGDDWLWKLPRSARLTDPQRGKIALLMNGLDRTALESAETVDRWETLRSALPEQTEVINEEISRWHQIQADVALVNQKHPLEVHHMRKVVEFYPEAYGASNQLEHAIQRARKSR